MGIKGGSFVEHGEFCDKKRTKGLRFQKLSLRSSVEPYRGDLWSRSLTYRTRKRRGNKGLLVIQGNLIITYPLTLL